MPGRENWYYLGGSTVLELASAMGGGEPRHCILESGWREIQKYECYEQRLGGSTKCFSNDSEGTSVPRRDRDGRVGPPGAN